MKIEIQLRNEETFDEMKFDVAYRSNHQDLEDVIFVKVAGVQEEDYILEFIEGRLTPRVVPVALMIEGYADTALEEVGFKTTIDLNWKDDNENL